MSIFSQIGIVLMISGICAILFRTGRDLEKADREGEHFVDEWALKRAREQEQRDLKKAESESAAGETTAGAAADEPTGRAAADEPAGESTEDKPLSPLSKEGSASEGSVSGRETEVPGKLYLEMLDENRRILREIPVLQLPFTIGRDPSCDLSLHDLCIARRHCMIKREGEALFIEDQGTRNRISVNGRAKDRIEIVRGCPIPVEIGDTVFMIRYL